MEKRKAGMSKGKLVTSTTAPRFKMRRLAVAVAVAMAASRADALGLGDLELHSALNQPLSAEVRLLVDNPKELEGAAVVLAPSDEFVRAGIERAPVLSDLKFDIVTDKGGAMVKITSSQPIRDPFLDFVVQLQWPAGRLLREYTVLLDPPVFGPEQHSAAAAPPATAATPAAPQAAEPAVNGAPPAGPPAAPPVSVPGAPPPRRAAAAPVPAAGLAGATTYGPTKRNDTLWDIASQVKPDDSVSVYQMMLVLLKANPEAFYNSNINSLKAGYVLRVPDKSTAAAIPEDRAVEEAVRQYRQWHLARGGVAAPASMPSVQQASAAAPAAGQNQEKDSARLRLVAPGAGGVAASGTQAQLNKLRSDLALALESSDSAKRESDELRSRVTALEGQINSLQRLLTLKNQALSDMQKPGGLPLAAAARKPAPVVEQTSATAVTPAKSPAEAAGPKPKPAAAPPEAPASGLMDDPAIVGAAGGTALLLLSVGWLMVRRRSAKVEHEPMGTPMAEEEPSLPINIRLGTSPAEEAEQGAAPSDDPQMVQVAEEVAQRAEQDMPRTVNDLDVMASPEGEIDPIVEADVYLAYRRYQQAEALVQTALNKQPERKDLQAKLLDIHYAAKNAAAFREVAENLYFNLGSNAQDPVWQRILPMGRELCPDSELFAPAEDHSHESAAAPMAETHPTEATPADDDKMEFDLNMDAANAGEERAMTATYDTDPVKEAESWESERVGSDFGSLDFGLDDGDLLAGTDVVGTKLDLARAYIDMGDADSARDILKEVTEEGNDQQKEEAQSLMEKIA